MYSLVWLRGVLLLQLLPLRVMQIVTDVAFWNTGDFARIKQLRGKYAAAREELTLAKAQNAGGGVTSE